jgi:2-polyprenyl-3-methyl-5-hydroxy-6-metoxy-1,4-benzoquinol methylase
MKNVKDEEIFSTEEEKRNFYNREYEKAYGTEIHLDWFQSHNPGKDDYFNKVVLPFTITQNLKSVLDVGADYGKYSVRFYNAGLKVTAVELTPERASRLNQFLTTYGYTDITIKCADIENGIKSNFDLIFLSDLLEHMENYKAAWKNFVEHSKYIYALIPKEDSWNWSPDHTVRFDDAMIQELIATSNGKVCSEVVPFDENNSWYTLIVKGNL